MDENKYDFSGWATRNNMRCSDGRTIMQNAFKGNDGMQVPMVWNHRHDSPEFVIGHAMLQNTDEGVYAYCSLNDTQLGKTSKSIIEHGDVVSLSIYANQLVERNKNVIHGNIREVSLVLAGANPGAYIEDIIQHGDIVEDEAIIYNGEDLQLFHSEDGEPQPEEKPGQEPEDEPQTNDSEKQEEDSVANSISHADGETKGKTVQDVVDSMTDEQRNVMYAIIGEIADEYGIDADEEEGDVKHNVFDNNDDYITGEAVLSHADMEMILADGKRFGSLKESVLAHAEDYGIDNIDYLFPDFRNLTAQPEFIKRRTEWVNTVMSAVSRSPFARVKTQFADITADDARAKGYIKGKLKKEEVFSLLKRTTDPQTVYKKQKLDRDDVIDITDFDVVTWIKGEMRIMLDEELARAILIGDGRLASDDDKISEDHIRPVWTDSELFTINATIDADTVTDPDERAKQFIRTAIKSRKNYEGSGTPVLFTTEDMLTDMLLLEDKMGRPLYDTQAQLATKLRVSAIVTVPVMEGAERRVDAKYRQLMGIIVNLRDYNVGADRGGGISMFDDFDIDYNQQKYLIETRCSGALVKPYSAIAIELESASDFQ